MKIGSAGMHPELRRRILEVARQCRRTRWIRCWVRFGGVTLGLTCLVTALLALLTPDGPVAPYLLASFAVAEAAALWRWVIRPLRKPITMEQVALFIDERHPELENRIVSAVEFSEQENEFEKGGQSTRSETRLGQSPFFVQKFLEETFPIVRSTSFKDLLDSAQVIRLGMSAFSVLAASMVVIALFPHLWVPGLGGVLPASMARLGTLPFTVEPGNVRVRRGDNQMIWVRSDRENRKVTLRWRVGDGAWQGAEMGQSEAPEVRYHEFRNVQNDIRYQVQFGRRRSAEFKLTAWTPPEIESIDLIYHYPDYLQRAAREVPNSGNITALEGTAVDLAVWVNKRLSRATLHLDSGESIELAQSGDGLWAGRLVVDKNDRYHITLTDLEEAPSEYDSVYKITSQRDKSPDIKIDFPRGDSEVTMIDEVPFDFTVTDDFGFAEFGLQYEVAGEEPVRISLNTSSEVLLDAEGHYDISLEELGLEVGDLITWTVWAIDAKPGRNEYERLGDPYFLEIRPFRRFYEEAVSGGGAGQGGGQSEEDLSTVQKDIIIATWGLRRDSKYVEEVEFERRRDIIVETQDELAEKVAGDGAMTSQPKPEMIRLQQAMQQSIKALKRAEHPDSGGALSEATVHQQQAFRLILKLQPNKFEVQQGQNSGGGGGGGSQRPDIQSLEMDRNRNFYEDENLSQEEQEAADEVLSKIKELAQRQQIVNEDMAKLISELQNAVTEEEREKIRRQLERLEEEMKENLERLDEVQQTMVEERMNTSQANAAAEALRRARNQMNRSLEQIQSGQLQQARASGSRASDALDDITQSLEQFTRNAAAQKMARILEQMERIEKDQESILDRTKQLEGLQKSPSLDDQDELDEIKENLLADKGQLAEDFVELMAEASDLAERAKASQELMSRELGDWLRETSREGIVEDIMEMQYLQYGIWDAAVSDEEKIARKIADATEELRIVAGNSVEDDLEGMQKALENLDPLLAMRQEGAEAGQAAEGGEEAGSAPGREEQPGEDGQGGQGREPGQEGRTGQSGQSGQEGQNASEASEGQQSGGQSSASDGGSRGQPGSRSAAGGNTGPGGWDVNMRDFAERGYRDWIDRLRNAEALLPDNSAYREDFARVRDQVQYFRNYWRQRGLEPQYDLFLEKVAHPFEKAVDELQRDIQRLLSEKEFALADDGEIPEKYKQRVADYFKRLSESESSKG